MPGWRLAIDFGTSNTAAARGPVGARDGGAAEAVALSHGGNVMPSAVFADGRGLLVGGAAVNQAESRPDAFLPEPKRSAGSESVLLAGRRVPVAEVFGAVIGSVLERARRFSGGSMPDDVVLTHPEGWGAAELGRLVAGAESAGIGRGRLSLVSEPRAATYWYSAKRPVEPGQKVAVFDFGGGTLDVAVLTPAGDGSLQVVAARGDNSLGGRTLDARIRRWVEEELDDDDPELLRAVRSSTGASLALDRSIRAAKEVLSEAPRATIAVAARGREMSLMLTRGEFEGLIASDVDRALDVVRATLLDAGVRPGSSTLVYLTGGSARIPYVQDRLGELCRVATLDDPKTVVSRGALTGPTRRAGDVLAGVVSWVAPGAVSGDAGPASPYAPSGASSPYASSPYGARKPQPRPGMPGQGMDPGYNPYGPRSGGAGRGQRRVPQPPQPPQSPQQHPRHPQQPPQAYAATPAAAPAERSGGRGKLMLAGGAVAAVLLIGVAWAVGSGGDGKGDASNALAAYGNEPAPTVSWPDPALTDSDEIQAKLESVLPPELADIDTCQYSQSGVYLGGSQYPSYLCGYTYAGVGPTGPAIMNVLTDVDGVMDEVKSNRSDYEELNDTGDTTLLLYDAGSFAYFIYVDPQKGYVFKSGHFDDAAEAREFLARQGLA